MSENLNEKLIQQLNLVANLSHWKRIKYACKFPENDLGESPRDEYIKKMHKMHKNFFKSMKHGFKPNCTDEQMDYRGPFPFMHHPMNHDHGQGRILALLNLHEGINQRDLAYLLQIRPQSLGESLIKLEKSNFIERRLNENDKRSFNIYLTELGKQKATEMADKRQKTAEDMFNVLTLEEKEQLLVIFEKLISSLECKKEFDD